MRTLYHHWLSPACRKVRIALGEKKLPFDLVLERAWEGRPEFLALNPAGEVPVLIEEDGSVLADATAIVEYTEELHPDPPLLGGDALARAEIRRLVGWFDGKFNQEVTMALVGEKLFKRQTTVFGPPDSRLIRSGYTLIRQHMAYIGWLAERRRWLAGDLFSLADVTAAAHLSSVDYIGDVPWDTAPSAKEWYARVKSRPSVRPLLADHLPGIPPPRHYADPDF